MIGSGDLRTWLDRFSWSAGRLNADSHTFGWAVARGLVPNAERLFFRTACGSSAGSDFTVYDGASSTIPWPTVDGTLTFNSTNANDDGAPAGTGAWTVRFWWLDVANVEATEDITLNGVGNVVSVANTIRRVNKMQVQTASAAGGVNLGTIDAVHSSSVTLFRRIRPGAGNAGAIVQTVPAGKRDWITDIQQGWSRRTAGEFCRLALIARTSPTAPWVNKVTVGWQSRSRHLDYPIRLEAGTDYTMRVKASTQAVGVVVEGFRETL